MKLKYKDFIYLLLAITQLALISCNEDFPRMLKEDYGTTEAEVTKSKVLLVVVDGLRGSAITDIDPENLRLLSRNSLYSNNSFGDDKVDLFTREVGLANIMTGVRFDKHKVESNDISTLDVNSAPSFIARMKSNYNDFHAEAYTSSKDVKEKLFAGVDETTELDDDKKVVESVKSNLASTQSNLVIAHLNNPYLIGNAKSYESEDSDYRDAVLTLDDQIGDLVEAVNNRPNVKKEKWLIILTSSVGGVVKSDLTNGDKTAFGDSRQNTFTYFYSTEFGRKFIVKPNTNNIPFQGAAMRFVNKDDKGNATSARLLDNTKLNIGPNDNVTITFFYKQNLDWWFWWTPFVQKWSSWGNGSRPGYIIFMAYDGRIGMDWFGGDRLVSENVSLGPVWHVITIVFDRKAKKARMFTDGKLSSEKDLSNSSLANVEPLVIGRSISEGGGDGDVMLCNFQFYNVAMSNEEVERYAKLSLVTEENSPYYNNLLAYWPFYENNGENVVTDVTTKAGDLQLFNNVRWQTFSDQSAYIMPNITSETYRIVPNTVDIPLFIMQWFGVIPKSDWKLESKSWTPPYKVLEY
ncbi:LamG-like jellyroll fold domain-containing protein [Sphingobacterium bovistauri]|uniref:DUF4983 domain-containing protein n=1 Tax=Sphingobacterium bovistauri TaxID=2781959 RepID=A0ABS7Z6V1_9SPHI|nr:LamG-like jellyroll fold domain-containing protein [Sphingobacterium bovistauri]MCA5005910.1 DUF4983 domain-containing protein [Sphingobacterium bovistauri]